MHSASVVINQSAAIVGEDRFYPFGETRFTTGNMQTDKLFTGQRAMASLGIYHYNARFYSPKLGRFLSADTIVPNPADPQHLNRFSYMANNPLKYIDPSGHKLSAFDGGGGSYKPAPKKPAGDNYCASHPWTCVGSKPDKPKGKGGGGGTPSTDVSVPNSPPSSQPSHEYVISNIVCPAAFACTQEEMKDYLSRFAYPGQNSSEPVVDGEDYYVAPFNSFTNDPAIQEYGHIQVSVLDGGMQTINRTLPGHVFYNGVVERTLTQESDGSWRVTTDGYGTNTSIEIALINGFGGPEIFQEVDEQMKAYILQQYLPGAVVNTPDQLIP